ncbi:MAG TPA: SDR family NAD(P)-dependent oxidoreductase, partial [Agriterribacter sp.]|nr:SDR family NAD(P)-dependent oxidoreductase [Agriterribacter sp.]
MTAFNHFDLSGKRALITGGSKGLGFAIANAFIHSGAEVIITGRNQADLESACTTLGRNCKGVVFDLNDIKGIPGFVEEIEMQYGAVDILVNNAGINLKKEITEVTDEDYANVIRVNQQAVFSLSRELAKKMITRKTGSILMVSSMASQYGIPKVIA